MSLQQKIRSIAIDDEPLALRQLRHYISQIPEIELLSTLRSAVAAKEYLANTQEGVDLIFCDINMPGMSGVEFVQGLQSDSAAPAPMVIFTTAYSEYAVEGFRLDAVDYLLKPFPYVDFERAVRRAISLYELRNWRDVQQEETQEEAELQVASDAVKGEDGAEPSMEYISVKADYKVTMVRLSDIIYIESEGEYVRIHIEGHRPITTLFRLKNMEAQLPASLFVRVHRSYIVNVNRVYSYDRTRVYISKEEYLPIGQNYRVPFQQRLAQREGTLQI